MKRTRSLSSRSFKLSMTHVPSNTSLVCLGHLFCLPLPVSAPLSLVGHAKFTCNLGCHSNKSELGPLLQTIAAVTSSRANSVWKTCSQFQCSYLEELSLKENTLKDNWSCFKQNQGTTLAGHQDPGRGKRKGSQHWWLTGVNRRVRLITPYLRSNQPKKKQERLYSLTRWHILLSILSQEMLDR